MAAKANESLFDDFGGYYSVRENGVEFAKFAPGPIWTSFWITNGQPAWTFAWIPAPS